MDEVEEVETKCPRCGNDYTEDELSDPMTPLVPGEEKWANTPLCENCIDEVEDWTDDSDDDDWDEEDDDDWDDEEEDDDWLDEDDDEDLIN